MRPRRAKYGAHAADSAAGIRTNILDVWFSAFDSIPDCRAFIAGIPSADKTLKEVAGGFHEVMFEDEGPALVDGMAAWIKARAAGASAAGAGGGGGEGAGTVSAAKL